MRRKEMRKIWNWRNEKRRKKAGCLNPTAPLAFRARGNRAVSCAISDVWVSAYHKVADAYGIRRWV